MGIRKVIAFHGCAGAGKSTAAWRMFERMSDRYTVDILSFAKPLKDTASQLGWDNRKDTRGRVFLQHLGDVLKEYHGKDYFTRMMVTTILNSTAEIIVIDDMRFDHEAEMLLKEFPSELVRIQGRGYSDVPSHVSEIPLDHKYFAYVIENSVPYDKYLEKVDALCELIRWS